MTIASAPVSLCPACRIQLAPALLSCPACHSLVHRARLTELATLAGLAESEDDLTGALVHWREALTLLPADSTQYDTIATRIGALGRQVDSLGVAARAKNPETPIHRRLWASLVAGGIFLLSKLKLLLLGLTKITTLLSMVVYFGVYWELWGWRFALGLVGLIYIHEMGHIAAFRRYGIKTTVPMFIPGLGALIRYREVITDPRQESRVGLAGPWWGLGATLAAYGVYRWTGAASWGATAKMGGFINLFNMIPVWQLDGAHGMRSMSRVERWLCVAAAVAIWLVSREGFLVLIAAAGAYQALRRDAPATGDSTAMVSFATLIAVLTWLAALPIATG